MIPTPEYSQMAANEGTPFHARWVLLLVTDIFVYRYAGNLAKCPRRATMVATRTTLMKGPPFA